MEYDLLTDPNRGPAEAEDYGDGPGARHRSRQSRPGPAGDAQNIQRPAHDGKSE
jgi:hypothetical protein